MSAVVARCSGCGAYSTDRRILTCCKGYCYDASGKTCNAVQCPGCGRFHYWCGSFVEPAADATIFDAVLSCAAGESETPRSERDEVGK